MWRNWSDGKYVDLHSYQCESIRDIYPTSIIRELKRYYHPNCSLIYSNNNPVAVDFPTWETSSKIFLIFAGWSFEFSISSNRVFIFSLSPNVKSSILVSIKFLIWVILLEYSSYVIDWVWHPVEISWSIVISLPYST